MNASCVQTERWLLLYVLKVKATDPYFSCYILSFDAAQPAWSVLQSDCVMADQPKNIFNEGHICDRIDQRLIKLQVMY